MSKGKKTLPKAIFASVLIVAILVGFGGGFVLGKYGGSLDRASGLRGLGDFESIFSKEPTFDLLREGIDIINNKYAGNDSVSREDLIYGAMEGMLKALGDPHSVFLNPEDSKIFHDDVGGTFEGIGAEIGIRDGVLTVISPLKDNPAERAGLKAGDKILYVDETDTAGLLIEEAVKIIRGPKGTEVVLTVSRKGEEDELKISITRDTIKIPTIVWEKKDGNVAYISLYHFIETASGDFEEIAHEILQSDTEAIILDLRNNPGGFLEVSVDIAGWFLETGATVVIEDRGAMGENKVYNTRGNASLAGYPLVLLVNQGSASASEILAGALRDHRGIQLVGERTFGKGSVQEVANLSDRSSIKITVAKWLTPNGLSIEGNGLEPDVLIEMTQEIFEERGDVQLEKAIELVRGL